MLTAIRVRDNHYDVDEVAHEGDIRNRIVGREPYFFQKTNGRKRELYNFYRGCIICSYTATGTGWSKRCHVPYIVCHREGMTLCLSTADFKTVDHAKRAIDRMFATGVARD